MNVYDCMSTWKYQESCSADLTNVVPLQYKRKQNNTSPANTSGQLHWKISCIVRDHQRCSVMGRTAVSIFSNFNYFNAIIINNITLLLLTSYFIVRFFINSFTLIALHLGFSSVDDMENLCKK